VWERVFTPQEYLCSVDIILWLSFNTDCDAGIQ